MHGVGNCLSRMFRRFWNAVPKFIAWLCTFVYVVVAYVFFRADNIMQGWFVVSRMIKIQPGSIHKEVLASFSQPELKLLSTALGSLGLAQPELIVLLLFVAFCLLIAVFARNSTERLEGFSLSIKESLVTVALLVWCIFSFAGVSTFLYFNF